MNNTLLKGLEILEIIARWQRPVGVSELAASTGMPKSSVHRVLRTLLEARYLVRHQKGTYATSIKLWELGSAALLGYELRQQATTVMDSLVQETGETAHLSVLDGAEVVYIHKIDSPEPVRSYNTQIGGRAVAHCVATGKAMLAYKDTPWQDYAAQRLVPVTPSSITCPAAFAAEMRRIKERGYAINLGEWQIDVNGVAAPIFDRAGNVIAAVGVSGPASRLPVSRMHCLSGKVIQSALKLAQLSPDAHLLAVTRYWNQPL